MLRNGRFTASDAQTGRSPIGQKRSMMARTALCRHVGVMSGRYFDPEERIREKQLARDQDERDLAEGKVSAAELQRRNSLLSGFELSLGKFEIRNPVR
jgi:hypothetical protein